MQSLYNIFPHSLLNTCKIVTLSEFGVVTLDPKPFKPLSEFGATKVRTTAASFAMQRLAQASANEKEFVFRVYGFMV